MVLGIGAPAPNQSSPREAWCKHTGSRAHPRQVFCAPPFLPAHFENRKRYHALENKGRSRHRSSASARCHPQGAHLSHRQGLPGLPKPLLHPWSTPPGSAPSRPRWTVARLRLPHRVNRGPNPGHQLTTPGQQEGAGLTAPTCLCFHSCQVGVFGLCSPAPDSRGSRDPLNLACTPPVTHLKTTKSGKSTDLEPPVTSLPSGPQRLLLRAMPGPQFCSRTLTPTYYSFQKAVPIC